MTSQRLLNRRTVLRVLGSGLIVSATAIPSLLSAQEPTASPNTPTPNPPPLAPDLVQSVVGFAHGSLKGVTELVEANPGLANACWDWGGGDFETALGAASHVGQRNIAEYLLSKGARMDIFAATMLGKIAIVRAVIEDNPAVVRDCLGPHKLPMLHHAERGENEEMIALIKEALARL